MKIENQYVISCELSKYILEKAPAGIFVKPSLPRHEFFIDFWNDLFINTNYQIERFYTSGGQEDNLVFHGKKHTNSKDLSPFFRFAEGSDLLLNTEICLDKESLLEDLFSKTRERYFGDLSFQFKIQNGMFLVQEKELSHVLFMMDDLELPHESMLEEFVSALYLAKTLGQGNDVLKRAIRRWTDGPNYKVELETNFCVCFEDHCLKSSWETLKQTLRYHKGELYLISSGDLTDMPIEIEELIIRKNVNLISIETQVKQPLLQKYANIYKVESMTEAIGKIWGSVEGNAKVFFFPDLGKRHVDNRRWPLVFRNEVLAR